MLQLESQVQTFQRLSSEITSISYEWKEYFDVSRMKSTFSVTIIVSVSIKEKDCYHYILSQAPPYLLGYMPVYFDACTLGQKLLLWKTFQPEKVKQSSSYG